MPSHTAHTKGYSPAPDPLQGLQASNTRFLQEPLPPQWLHQTRRVTQRVTTFSVPSDCFSTRRTGTRSHLRPEPWHHTQVSNFSRTNRWPSPAHTPQAKRQASPWQFPHKSGSKRVPEQPVRTRTTAIRKALKKTRFTRQIRLPIHVQRVNCLSIDSETLKQEPFHSSLPRESHANPVPTLSLQGGTRITVQVFLNLLAFLHGQDEAKARR